MLMHEFSARNLIKCNSTPYERPFGVGVSQTCELATYEHTNCCGTWNLNQINHGMHILINGYLKLFLKINYINIFVIKS